MARYGYSKRYLVSQVLCGLSGSSAVGQPAARSKDERYQLITNWFVTCDPQPLNEHIQKKKNGRKRAAL